MLSIKKNTTLICLVITSVLLFNAGCSSTRTQESTDQYVHSSTTTARVKADLLADPSINALQINVKTYKNIVQLSGFVDSYREKQRAVAIAKRAPGVESVEDSLVVKPARKH